MHTTETKYVGAAALADRFDVHPSAFDRWIKTKGFPPPRYLGSRRLWLLSEVEAWEVGAFSDRPNVTGKLDPFKRVQIPDSAR